MACCVEQGRNKTVAAKQNNRFCCMRIKPVFATTNFEGQLWVKGTSECFHRKIVSYTYKLHLFKHLDRPNVSLTNVDMTLINTKKKIIVSAKNATICYSLV